MKKIVLMMSLICISVSAFASPAIYTCENGLVLGINGQKSEAMIGQQALTFEGEDLIGGGMFSFGDSYYFSGVVNGRKVLVSFNDGTEKAVIERMKRGYTGNIDNINLNDIRSSEVVQCKEEKYSH